MAALITATYVIMVPFLSALFRLGPIKLVDIISAGLAFTGIAFITGIQLVQFKYAYYELFACAFSIALMIVCLQYICQKTKDTILLTFYQIAFIAVFGFLFTGFNYRLQNISSLSWFAILWCGIAATSVAVFIQTRFQRDTSANQAAVIYSLEPIFAMIFAYFFNNEPMGWHVLVAAVFILAAFIIPLLPSMMKNGF